MMMRLAAIQLIDEVAKEVAVESEEDEATVNEPDTADTNV